MVVYREIPTSAVEKLLVIIFDVYTFKEEGYCYCPVKVHRNDKDITVYIGDEPVLIGQDLWEGNCWRLDVDEEIHNFVMQALLRSL